MKLIYDYQFNDLEKHLLLINQKKYKTSQIFKWLYKKLVISFNDMSDLKKELIDYLNHNFIINPLKLKETYMSKDHSVKYLFQLNDGHLIETVLMKFDYGNTICVTSQVGCNLGCKFCASGLYKKIRNLTTGEIVAQVINVNRYLLDSNERINNVVIMGIGEPFDNYNNVLSFCNIINDDKGLEIGSRHITISTCGLVNKIKEFAEAKTQYNLAISLHASNNDIRNQLMPINKIYNIETLIDSLRYYSNNNNRKLTIEYIMIDNLNDQKEHAKELSKLLKNINCFVNLISYNPIKEFNYKGSTIKTIMTFYDILMKNNIKATIRNKVGDDINAACGQLRINYKDSI